MKWFCCGPWLWSLGPINVWIDNKQMEYNWACWFIVLIYCSTLPCYDMLLSNYAEWVSMHQCHGSCTVNWISGIEGTNVCRKRTILSLVSRLHRLYKMYQKYLYGCSLYLQCMFVKEGCNSSALRIKQIFVILQQIWPVLRLTCSRCK
jgi:hypothetical protein